jgi:hypothetical protein
MFHWLKSNVTISICSSLVILAGCQQVNEQSQAASAVAAPAASTVAAARPVTNGDAILVGAGDVASCDDLAGAKATARLLDSIPGTVFVAGDLAYPDGSAEQFTNCYGPTWGRQKARTRPSPGNHEFHSGGATPYFDYFGAAAGDPAKGYYSYDLGAWHVIVINSNCSELPDGCAKGSPEEQWLKQDLAQHATACTVAYWHHPLFSSGKEHGNDPEIKPFWEDLYAANADVVINGHDHDYERFAPQDPDGKVDTARGIREFVVGSGGKNSHRTFGDAKPNSEVRNSDTFGVLKLTLHAKSYDWEFIPEEGKNFRDSGSGTCH